MHQQLSILGSSSTKFCKDCSLRHIHMFWFISNNLNFFSKKFLSQNAYKKMLSKLLHFGSNAYKNIWMQIIGWGGIVPPFVIPSCASLAKMVQNMTFYEKICAMRVCDSIVTYPFMLAHIWKSYQSWNIIYKISFCRQYYFHSVF